MRYLLDLSAWAHSGHEGARDRWADLIDADAVVCHPVFAVELLHSAVDPGDYHRLRADLDDGFEWLWPDRETSVIALQLQEQMAVSAPCGQRVKTPDLLIAALAVQHGLGVVHYDSDFDVILERGGRTFSSEWLAPRGSLRGPVASASPRRAYTRAFGQRMAQLRNDGDLDLWPDLLAWMDEQLAARGLPVPAPADV